MRGFLITTLLWIIPFGLFAEVPSAKEPSYTEWLRGEAMLLKPEAAGTSEIPHQGIKSASVWFAPYPFALVSQSDASALSVLASSTFWNTLQKLSVDGLHLGSIRQSGSLLAYVYQHKRDDYKDWVGPRLDPDLGDGDDLEQLGKMANTVGVQVFERLSLGQLGEGADFQLALRGDAERADCFLMCSVEPTDWHLLPDVMNAGGNMPLAPESTQILLENGVLKCCAEAEMPALSGWSATGPIHDHNQPPRRWIYFSGNEPGYVTLNWARSGTRLADSLARLARERLRTSCLQGFEWDLSNFLDYESAINGALPYSQQALALMHERLEGLAPILFMRLEAPLEIARGMLNKYPGYLYDTWTHPLCYHALLTGDAGTLRLMLRQMHAHQVGPERLIHSMQEDSPFASVLSHCMARPEELFTIRGEPIPGKQVQALFSEDMERLKLEDELKLRGGYPLTSAALSAKALGIQNLEAELSIESIRRIQQGHLLLAFFQAMQPGVFLFSGWDLVGALPLTQEQLLKAVEEGRARSAVCGAYDLLGLNPEAEASFVGVPRSRALYGDVCTQLKNPDSFASHLRDLIQVRKAVGIAEATRLEIPQVSNRGVIVILHQLADGQTEATAINFGRAAVKENLVLPDLVGAEVTEWMSGKAAGLVEAEGHYEVRLNSLEGKVFTFKPQTLASASSGS